MISTRKNINTPTSFKTESFGISVGKFQMPFSLAPFKWCICLLLVSVIFLPACKKAEDIKISSPKPEKDLVVEINSKRVKTVHLFKDTVYNLINSISREAGEVLIIDPGTLIKCLDNTTGITINPGGQLLANGTQNEPIVFTSGAYIGTQAANWAGIEIKGKSIDNSSSTTPIVDDFSCSLKYVRIEFAALTLNAVGSKSILENIQVSYTITQASFRVLGGTFNARNLVSYACGGFTDYYFTKGYTGNLQNLLALRNPYFDNIVVKGSLDADKENILSGVLIENDRKNPDQTPFTFPVISNLTVIGPHIQNGLSERYSNRSLLSGALVVANNARFKIRNSYFSGFPTAGWYVSDRQSASNYYENISEIKFSIFHCNDTERTFFVDPAVGRPYSSAALKQRAISSGNVVEDLLGAGAFYKVPFNYETPDLLAKEGSALLTGANFEDADYANAFFTKVGYRGAIAQDNWLEGWTNFKPLLTDYNLPK